MTIQMYRRKTSEVEAVRYDGHNHGELVDWGTSGHFDEQGALWLWVHKFDASRHIKVGDYILREQDGSGFYPCDGAQFHSSYDLVNGEPLHEHG